MRVAFVVPRYGPEIIGGAETAARRLAEGLVAVKGWEVEVLTSCAEDFVTWADVYPEGDDRINGVVVHRFRSAAGRDPSFHPLSAALLADPGAASKADAERWLDLQGPVTPTLAAAAEASTADVVVFYPYLYYPTARVIDRVMAPTVLHPAAHDEPALHLPVFPRVFAAADALVFQTEAERELVQGIFPVASHPQLLLGLGVDDPAPGSLAREPDDPPPPEVPYLLCLGRVDDHKGTTTLASMFSVYKQRHPGPLRLVLAGPVVEAPAPHPDIDVVGPVSEAAKWELLRRAVALVSPSRWEAFSLVIAEAWSARTPVVVNAACGATTEHCERSGGGLSFNGYAEFEVIVERLGADPALAAVLGRRGRAYVDSRFRWPIVIDRYARFLQSVAAANRSDAAAQRSGTGVGDHSHSEHGGAG
ncbi:MAG TPA: glycosyltransferase family 4 protein [Acidimicrobiales bacterium]|jgi:glycosyltransferase involved in cell wall biosynthesis|nr:glycosyltransferase family 4 protein [Acidimicrobiales bacterium]